jgi:hypothetical protein
MYRCIEAASKECIVRIKHLAYDVNLRRTLITLRSSVVVTAFVAAAAAARTLFARIARISVGSRLFGGRSDIFTIFFLVLLKEIEKQM